MNRLLLSSCLWLVAGAATLLAGEPAAVGTRVDVQMLSLPLSRALPLLAPLRNPKTFEATRERLQSMLAAGTAELLAWPFVQTVSGQLSVSQSELELDHREEFPEGDAIFNPPGPFELPAVQLRANPWQIDIPLAFQWRNLGPVLEVEPLYDGVSKDLTLSTRVTWRRAGPGTVPIGVTEPYGRQQTIPDFRESQVSTTVTMTNGGHALLGVFMPQEKPDRVLIFLIHAVATP